MSLEVVQSQLESVRSEMVDIKGAVQSIALSMAKIAILEERFEERHAHTKQSLGRAFDAIERFEARAEKRGVTNDERFAELEKEMPNLKLSAKAMWLALAGIAGLVGEAAFRRLFVG